MIKSSSTTQHSSYQESEWRLIQTPPSSGAWNMAVDEAVLENLDAVQPVPVLRLYAWSPPCLSLGYAQPFSDVDKTALTQHHWEVVRRPTGGRAILHTDELTYSVIGPAHEPRLEGGVLESYQRLSAALLQALHHLDVPAQSQSKADLPTGSDPKGPVCFEVPSNYEITVNGKKLIGSAQSRRRKSVLQHGSLPLYGDLTRITQVLVFPDEVARSKAAARLLSRAATVEESLGITVKWDEAAAAFIKAFQESLNLRFITSQLTPRELQRAQELVAGKYANPKWTERF